MHLRKELANRHWAAVGALATFVGVSVVSTASVTSARAQTDAPAAPAPAPDAGPAEKAAVITGDARTTAPEKHAEAAQDIPFAEVGKTITSVTLKLPTGAESIRQLSAPLGGGTVTVLLNLYKMNGAVFMDVFTSRDNTAYSKQNHIKLISPLPIRPTQMTVSMRYLKPLTKRGFVLIAKDESADIVMAFPTNFGGSMGLQQIFLTQSKDGSRHSYAFGDQDSRGFTIVRESLDTSGQVKPADDVQYFVWDGRKFVPRLQN